MMYCYYCLSYVYQAMYVLYIRQYTYNYSVIGGVDIALIIRIVQGPSRNTQRVYIILWYVDPAV